jgi:putative ABC transport system permease protein
MEQPPRLARMMVEMAAPDAVRESLLGDLEEQFADGLRHLGPARARRRYWRQSMGSLLPVITIRRTTTTRTRRSFEMASIWRDIRIGVRTALHSPGYSLITALTLALAIGANTLLFSVASPLVIRPLPIRDQDTLGWIIGSNPSRNVERSLTSLPDFLDYRANLKSFSALAAYDLVPGTLTGQGDARRIQTARTTANLFEVWGIAPEIGRGFNPGDDAVGQPLVGVLSHRFWQEAFQSDRAVIGRSLFLDGRPITITGVLPAAIEIGNLSAIDVWAPLVLDPSVPRDHRTLRAVGRLAPGVTIESADAEFQPVVANLAREYPKTNETWQMHVKPTTAALAAGDTFVILGLLGVVVGFVLLIACANLANLVLARLVARQQEAAVRLALGASRWQLIRPLMAESLMLSLVGGLVGLAIAGAGLRVINAAAADPFLRTVGIDGYVLAFNVVLSVITPLLFTLWPALTAGRAVTTDALRGTRVSGGRAAGRRRNFLVGGQVALALSLLVVSSLVVQSMLYLSHIEPGYDVNRLLSWTFELPKDRYPDGPSRARFVVDLEGQVALLPGAEGAGFISAMPTIDVEVPRQLSGTPRDGQRDEDKPWASWYVATPGFFRAAGIPVLAGRTFTSTDTKDSAPVIVLNALAAERYFGRAAEAIGQTLTVLDSDRGAQQVTIVGVVADTRNNQLTDTSPQAFAPHAQRPDAAMTGIVRAADPVALAAALQALMRRVDSMVAISTPKSVQQILYEDLASSRIINGLFVSFALLALALAAAGLYGVISYSVGQRRREIGIRLALGAAPRTIGRMIVGEGLRVVAVGLVLGLLLALLLARASSSVLYGISGTDPATYLGVTLAVVAVTLVATWSPAARAMRVDPARTLRAD